MFITLEGADGVGKSTQIKMLADYLTNLGKTVVCTREPGGSQGAEDIRSLILSGDVDRWSARTEMLLFMAARRDHVEKTILPAIEAGKIILCDRFVDSTRAYQSGDPDMLDMIDELHDKVICCDPDLTLLYDMPAEEALKRSLAKNQSTGVDEVRFEEKGIAFQKTVRLNFLELAKMYSPRIKTIHASGDPEEVFSRTKFEIDRRIMALSL